MKKEGIRPIQCFMAFAAILQIAWLSACRHVPAGQADPQAFTFVQLCDPQLGMGGYAHDVQSFRQAGEKINQLKPDFVLICGDLVHERTEQSFADFKEIRSALTVPSYCVPGNHDVGGAPTPATLKTYREMIGPDYYAVEHKGYTFVLVNTQLWKAPLEGETDRQDAWLMETLKAALKKKSPVFIVGHYPLYLEHPDEPEEYMNLPADKRAELLALYDRCGVVAVLGGHVHRLLIHEWKGLQLVNGETTSKNFDSRAPGFRLWYVDGRRCLRNDFVALEMDAH